MDSMTRGDGEVRDDGWEALTARVAELEEECRQLGVINNALMDRVELDMDRRGNSFSLFQAATVLESKVNQRTSDLKSAMRALERNNRKLQDLTREAQAASRAKSVFLAAMSHELRTPMNGVVGMTEYLLTTSLNEDQRGSLVIVRDSAMSLLRILNDILDFSKIEAGYLELESTPFDLRDAMGISLNLLRQQIESKGLFLEVDWPEAVPASVIGDPTRFSQIINNLVGNALKFTARGYIRVRTTLEGESEGRLRYRFLVEDSGCGIREEALPKLFRSFSQADSSTTREYGGTGLGLVIVRRLCQLMGGECGASSEYGKGSTFWFTVSLPRADASAVKPRDLDGEFRSRPVPGISMSRPHVLLVEDNEINQVVAGTLLKSLNCSVVLARNGVSALTALEQQRFSLVLMDCQMPEMDGFEATRRIREREAAGVARTPIVALTANDMSGDREACLAAGMDDFLSKPFRLQDLESMLRKWCSPSMPSGAARRPA